MHEARAVEQHIDRADLGGDLAYRRFVGDIQNAGLDSLIFQLGKRFCVDIGRPHPGAFACKGERRSASDTLPGRGDECDLAFKPACHGIPLRPREGGDYKCNGRRIAPAPAGSSAEAVRLAYGLEETLSFQ